MFSVCGRAERPASRRGPAEAWTWRIQNTLPGLPDRPAGIRAHRAKLAGERIGGRRLRLLVTGAAGYIGSVVTERLLERRHEVLALDSLKYGHRAAVHPDAEFLRADILDSGALDEALRDRAVDAVIHLAAESRVDLSAQDPGLFFKVNVAGGIELLEAMHRAGISTLVFSSTAAVYGEPDTVPIPDDAPCNPVNAYGESKLQFERVLHWYRLCHGLRFVSLRYFNACGASARFGEWRKHETHILPILFEAALGNSAVFRLFGEDYPTPDGTCVRDYVHVLDVADAHVLALERIDEADGRAYNVGTGRGYSNLEVIRAVEAVTGKSLNVEAAPRRPGDPARLVAANARIRDELGWSPTYADLESMVHSAWSWRLENPRGYEE